MARFLSIYLHQEHAVHHSINNTHTCVKLTEPMATKTTLELRLFSRKVLYHWRGLGLCLARMEIQPCLWGGHSVLFNPRRKAPLQVHHHYLGGAPKVQVRG